MLVLFLLLAAVPVAFAQAALSPEEASEVLAKLDEVNSSFRTLSCVFVQTRHSEMFTEDLVSRGRVTVRKPCSVEVELVSPVKKKYTLDGTRASVQDNPALRILETLLKSGVSSMSGFDVKVKDEGERWTLFLLPLAAELKAFLGSVTVSFDKADRLARVLRIEDPDGSYTLMEFDKLKAD